MTLFLLQGHRDEAQQIADAIDVAIDTVKTCEKCHTLADEPICPICANPKRSNGQLCVVETPADLIAIEETESYSGRYFVLNGLLSPIDGIGPEELRFGSFLPLIAEASIKEVVVALNATAEGEATTHFIRELLKDSPVKLTQLAHGIPVGGELGYVNSRTIEQAFHRRINLVS